ncbi:tol-pal system protein YbgF [bacterium BMS3Abin03]|nr:tol-pal system protein YbgF [bacterium BMS3Abin03]
MKSLIYILILLTITFIGCSPKKTAQELFDEGMKLTTEKKIPEAVNSYESLLQEYPDNKLAPETIVLLAGIYQNKLLKNIAEKESLNKSVELFKSIYEKYPQSKEAPMGLFMAGFVQANELKDFNAATETYNLFIKLFPDHELASSAKEELNNMGLTPEEILQKKIAKED